jgi:hypothetical protein
VETALYLPVKHFLENLGFTVKGEIGGCDLVALSGDDPPIVVVGELKLSFNLELILQAVDRAGACDEVWLAAKLSARGKGRENDARYRNLCRRLGFGMLAVTNTGEVEVLVKPPTTSPRRGIGWKHARADHDGLSPAGAGLRVRIGARSAARARSQAPNSGRTENSAAQLLWLVRSRRTRRLCPHRRGSCRTQALAAAADGFGRRRRFNLVTAMSTRMHG